MFVGLGLEERDAKTKLARKSLKLPKGLKTKVILHLLRSEMAMVFLKNIFLYVV